MESTNYGNKMYNETAARRQEAVRGPKELCTPQKNWNPYENVISAQSMYTKPN